MVTLSDRVRETTASTGTGEISLGGAFSGFQTFAQGVGNNADTLYTIHHLSQPQWEVGRGVYNAGKLTRVEVYESSNAGNLVNFSAGTKEVFITVAAAQVIPRSEIIDLPSIKPTLMLDFANSRYIGSHTNYTRGSAATGWVNGRLHEFAIDEPRFVTDPATGYSGLLLEPVAQTNLLRSSGDFSQPVWDAGGAEKIPGQSDSRGGNNAVTVLGPLTVPPRQNGINTSSAGIHTQMIVAKAVEGRKPHVLFMVRNQTLGVNFQTVSVNLETGVSTTLDAKVIKLANGFWGVVWSTRPEDTINAGDQLVLYWGATSISGSEDFGITVDFAQLVEGHYAGSYVPTGASQVTRAGDRFILPTDRFDYRPDRGTLLVDFVNLGTSGVTGGHAYSLSSGTDDYYGERFNFGWQDTQSRMLVSTYPSPSSEFGPSTPQISPRVDVGERVVTAFSWGDLRIVTAGRGEVSESSDLLRYPNVRNLILSPSTSNRGATTLVRRVLYYPERLPDAQLAALTEL